MDLIFLHGRTQHVLVEGSTSEKLDVLLVVPQGTVLGPPTFLVYINVLPTVCKTSQAHLFADYTLLYQHIRNGEDSAKLQENLIALEDLESRWKMSFHLEKYMVLRITTNKGYRRETQLFPPRSVPSSHRQRQISWCYPQRRPSMGEAHPSNSCQGLRYTWFPQAQLQGLQQTGP